MTDSGMPSACRRALGDFPFKKKVPLPFMLLSRNDGTCTDERWKLKIGYDIIRASEQEFAGAGMETVSMPEQVPDH